MSLKPTSSNLIMFSSTKGLTVSWCQPPELIRVRADSCGDVICSGATVLYKCIVPIRNSVIVVWRMNPQCQRGIQDITFLRNDDLLSTVCDDRRKIEVQGMDTSNGTFFESYFNVTNITSELQTVECIFDDGSDAFPIGLKKVVTTGEFLNCININKVT